MVDLCPSGGRWSSLESCSLPDPNSRRERTKVSQRNTMFPPLVSSSSTSPLLFHLLSLFSSSSSSPYFFRPSRIRKLPPKFGAREHWSKLRQASLAVGVIHTMKKRAGLTTLVRRDRRITPAGFSTKHEK
jgi:hypothetical protein